MTKSLVYCLSIALAAGAAYHFGQLNPREADPAYAQGRGPARPVPKKPDTPKPAQPMVFGDSGQVGASANGFIAVTGSYGVGTSVLYLLDTQRMQLSVYEARGGSQSMRRLIWVGARRIDLDMEVMGLNDESQFSREDLERMLNRHKGGGNLEVPAKSDGAGKTREAGGRRGDHRGGTRKPGK